MNAPVDREVAVFSEARRLSGGARSAYLDQTCGDDPLLRQRVEELLRASEDAGSFLQDPAPGAQRPVDATFRSLLPNTAALGEKAGDRIGRYKLLQQIGEGGCGVVYMAEQEEPVRRRVALKVIKLGMETKEVVARFEAERQALALMDHTNIAKVLDAGATDTGRPYFVMELVRGIKITQYCDENNLSTEERLDLFVKVAQAVQHAHQKGIIHRDIKPSNILVADHDGVPMPKVIDFGIAKATTDQRLTDKTLFTAFEQFIGTPAYMSPEQARMSGLDIDTRTDIYSLGVLLYELLTGKTPFDLQDLLATGLDGMRRTISDQEPARPSTRLNQELIAADVRRIKSSARSQPATEEEIRASSRRLLRIKELISVLRGDLDWIVMKALEKDRTRRYETANGLATDIQRHLKNEPVVARPPSNLYRFQKLVQRNKLAFAAGGVIAIVLALGFAGILWQWGRAERNAGAAIDKLRDAYIAQARSNRRSDRVGRRYDSLDAITKAAALNPSPTQREELRNEAIACFALTDLRLCRQWPIPAAGREGAWRFDSRLQLYARPAEQGGITIRQVTDDREIARLPGVGFSLNWIHFFSPDGRFLAVNYGNRTNCVWDIARQEIVFATGERSSWSFSPDSRLLALSHTDGFLSVVAVEDWKEVRRIRIKSYLRTIQFSGDGNKIVGITDERDRIETVDMNAGKLLEPLLGEKPQIFRCLACSTDGRAVAAGTDEGHIYLWDSATGQLRLNIEAHQNRVHSIQFDHAGTLLASASWDGTFRLWDALTGHLIISSPGIGYPIQFSENDRYIGYANSTHVVLQEIASHPEFRLLTRESRELGAWSLAFSPDGRLLAASDHQDIRFWDVEKGKELACLPGEGARSVHFHPDGKSLIASGPGLYRWPIERGAAETNTLRVGPRTVSIPESDLMYSELGGDGRFVAVAQWSKAAALVVDLENPSQLIRLGPHPDIQWAAISPDCRFVASGTWGGSGVKVWDVATRRLLRDLPAVSHAKVVFSPDGRWLATGAEDYRLYEVGSFNLRFKVPAHPDGVSLNDIALSNGGEVWAIGNHPRNTHLYATATGQRLAILEPPQQAMIMGVAFSPDGATLAVLQRDRAIQLWDLRRIRQQLAALDLDWDQPAYPAVAVQPETKPIRMEAAENPVVAERRAFLAREIPVRPPEADARLIDLSTSYNVSLTESWHYGKGRSDLSELTPGVLELARIHFDVRGVIQVGGVSRSSTWYPKAVTGIPVRQTCARLHFLHSAIAALSTPAGIAIGSYRVHYADGRQIEIPITLGKDVTNWFSHPEEDLQHVVVAWTGENEYSRQTGRRIRLFTTSWDNPYPSVPLTHLDLVAGSVEAKPFLVAITAE